MWAVVPLKSPEHAKSRLAGVLSPGQRRHLVFALAERVISALHATRGIDDVAIVTASREVAAFARRLGAQLILQADETGTASAFATAVQQLQPLQLRRLLMIAGDLPLVSSAAIEQVIAFADTQRGVVELSDSSAAFSDLDDGDDVRAEHITAFSWRYLRSPWPDTH